MAYDPNSGNVYHGESPPLPEGHYALRADEFDETSLDSTQQRPVDAVTAALGPDFTQPYKPSEYGIDLAGETQPWQT